ncbi:hypothetical protein EI94DRAFT_1034245 [Lactarius quietus]|nr:hypothetical protein EI94DRAFT_1034245 [Lactarius quietus]
MIHKEWQTNFLLLLADKFRRHISHKPCKGDKIHFHFPFLFYHDRETILLPRASRTALDEILFFPVLWTAHYLLPKAISLPRSQSHHCSFQSPSATIRRSSVVPRSCGSLLAMLPLTGARVLKGAVRRLISWRPGGIILKGRNSLIFLLQTPHRKHIEPNVIPLNSVRVPHV